MKKSLFVIAMFALVACGGPQKQTDMLTWDTDHISVHQDSSIVEMSFPVARGGAVADSINRNIVHALTVNLTESASTIHNISVREAVDATLAQRREAEKDLGSMPPYDMRSQGSVYEHDGVISVYLEQYLFLGGAHGMTMNTYLNFDKKNGKLLTQKDLIQDLDGLTTLNRNVFLEYWKTKGEEVSTDLLFVPVDQLPLPENIGLDADGLVMIYNAYEIAPYYVGQSRYVIPYVQAQPMLRNIAK